MFLQASYISVKPSVYKGKFTEEEIEKFVDILVDYTNEDDEFSWNYGVKNPELFIRQNFSKYLALFGNKKSLIIYRGLQFKTKKELANFLNAIDKNNGLLIEDRCRSWTIDKDVAIEFFERMRNQAYGCILRQAIGKNQGIVVPWDSKRMEFVDEKEVIIAPGKFKLDDKDWTVFPFTKDFSEDFKYFGIDDPDVNAYNINDYFKKWLKQ